MQVSKEKVGPSQYTLNVELEPERLQEPLRRAARRLATRRPLPGFRPGKAPYAMVERVYGKETIFDEMLDEMGSALYREALQQTQLEPYDQARFEILKLEPLTLKVEVAVQPEVTLGKYQDIRVRVAPATVSEDEVQGALREIQERQAVWVPVERAAKMGDQVLMDATGQTEDGKPIEQKDSTVELTTELVPPEFGQSLVGMGTGESKEFDVVYPEDFRDPAAAGKRAHFHVTVKSVREKELPELNDAFAQGLGSVQSLADLREKITQDLRRRKEAEAREAATTEALDSLVALSTLEYPAIAVEREVDAMVRSLTDRLTRQGLSLTGYLKMANKTLPQLRDDMRVGAENRLKRALVLSSFAQAEGIKVEPEEIDQEIERLSLSFGEQGEAVKDALNSERSRMSIADDVYRRKALDRLLAMASRSEDMPASGAASTGKAGPGETGASTKARRKKAPPASRRKPSSEKGDTDG